MYRVIVSDGSFELIFEQAFGDELEAKAKFFDLIGTLACSGWTIKRRYGHDIFATLGDRSMWLELIGTELPHDLYIGSVQL
jgi:hypothetical protein